MGKAGKASDSSLGLARGEMRGAVAADWISTCQPLKWAIAAGGVAERREKIRGRAISPTSSRGAVGPSQDYGPEERGTAHGTRTQDRGEGEGGQSWRERVVGDNTSVDKTGMEMAENGRAGRLTTSMQRLEASAGGGGRKGGKWEE